MNHLDTWIPGEPGSIEGQNGADSMRLHRRNQAGVVRGLSSDLVLRYQVFPNGINRGRLWQQKKHALEPRQFASSCERSHPETVLLNGPRSHNP
jgi:hypothetical protein